MSDVQELKDKLCLGAYGRLPDGKTCLQCNQEPKAGVNMRTEAGWREFNISGLCESCFDKLFAEPEGGAE